ncbi:MAG: hypothetical protein AB1921_01415 [Thermodesulfobacteriota bacterium]
MKFEKFRTAALLLGALALMTFSISACGQAISTVGNMTLGAAKSDKPENQSYTTDAEIAKAIKKYVSTSGSFKNLAKGKKFVVTKFNVEYTYQRYTSRVGEEQKVGNVTKTTVSDGYQTMRLGDDDYAALTDALYDSFVSAFSEYTGKPAVPRAELTANPLYQQISGSDKVDTKDHFFSARRGGNVQTGDKGAETVTFAPEGMKVQGMGAAFQINTVGEVTGKLGADICVGVNLYIDFDKSSDTFFIKTADITIADDMRVREKRIPFKGVVPGEYIYEFFATQDIKLKQPVSAGVKVTDRRTGFFEQVSGTYKLDTNAAAKSILEAYNAVAVLESMAAAREM